MDILAFIREYLDIRRDSKSYCKSCETLREQLAVTNHEKKILLEQILVKPAPIQQEREAPQPIGPKMVPWHIKRQMLEAEDRALAATIRRQKEDAEKATQERLTNTTQPFSIEDLEKELAVGESDAV